MTDMITKLLDGLKSRAAAATPVDLCVGAHWTLAVFQIEGQIRAGLSSTLSGGSEGHAHGGRPPVKKAGQLLNMRTEELLGLALSDSLLEASVGMATLNALLEVDMSQCLDINAADVIAERGDGHRVAVVGHFPFVAQLREIAKELWVLELNPGAGDLPATEAPDVLSQADVVALTGTSLLNKTFDGLISHCRKDAFVVVLGATTPLTPHFYRYGVDAVSGTIVVDADAAMMAVSQGATFRQIPGKRLLTMLAP